MLLRRNHDVRKNNRMVFVLRMMLFIVFLVFVLYLVLKNKNQIFNTSENSDFEYEDDVSERTFLPTHQGQILHKKNFSLSYLYSHKTAEWVAYRLHKEDLKERNQHQRMLFEQDSELQRGATSYYDYSGSGYERGHLVPAADMSFDSVALRQTYLLSNIIPQKRACNHGIWKELEIQVRDWVYTYEELYVISGPVYNPNQKMKKIKKSNIAIPDQFFKILMVYNHQYKGAIGFLVPNEKSRNHLHQYATDIDEIEEITGIDFFHFMLQEKEEEIIESTFDVSKFPVNEHRFKQRLEIWNEE